MQRIVIDIRTDGAVFDDHPELEVARILRRIATAIYVTAPIDRAILDVNGNSVGTVSIFD